MIQIPREVVKRLERSMLPSYVLDFLTEKFNECERYCEKAKNLEQEVQRLEKKLVEKEQMLMNMYQQGSSKGQQLGYEYPGQFKQEGFTNHYKPWEEDLKYREYFPEYRRSRGSRTEFSMANQGGGSPGNQGGQSGGTTSEYSIIPNVERVPKKQYPITEDVPYTERGRGLPEEY